MPMLSVVVLAWNQLELTQSCVESLRRHTTVDSELIIVDNGSEGDAASWAADAADVPVLNEENLGFAAGMNRGLEAATGRYVAFVNNDTVFPHEWDQPLLGVFDDHDRAGIVLPAVTAAGNPTSVRTEPGDDRIVIPPFQALPSGVVYLMQTDLARSVGGWDERFRIASREDLDLLFTMWSLGRDVVLDERVLVEHLSNATARAQLPDRDEIWMRNWSIFVEKWTGDDPTGGHPDTDPGRVQAAAAVAHWLDRWYRELRRVEELEGELRSRDRRIETLEARLEGLRSAEKPTESLRTHLVRTLPLVRKAIRNRTGL